MTSIFTVEDFKSLGVCREGLDRVAQFGGQIVNTADGWQAYVAAYEAWRAPLFTAYALKRRGWAIDPDLVWKIARIAFREAATIGRLAHLGQYAETLGPDTWQKAAAAAYDAYAAGAAYAAAADDAADAADAAAYAANAAAAADAAAADDAYAARFRVRREIVDLSIKALIAADPNA